MVYSTFLGGSYNDAGVDIAVDAAGNAYVTGLTGWSDFPTTPGAFDTSSNGDTSDAFVVKLNPAGSGLVYSTFLGGSDYEEVYAIAVDAAGNAYITGGTVSADFPTTPGAFDTNHNGNHDVFVAKLAIGGGDGIPSGPFTGAVLPVYPATHTATSRVMQGGTAYRYFRLLDANGNPIPYATVSFSVGNPATTDAQGYFTYAVTADTLGPPTASYAVNVQGVTIGGKLYTTSDQPTFSVEVAQRRYAHSWEAGAVRKGDAGVSIGAVAYLARETNGGIALTLEETSPDTTTDDRVTVAESYADEGGTGFGAEFVLPIETGQLISVEGPGSHMLGEILLRTEGGVSRTFITPYEEAARKAQGVMLLAGVADSLTGFPGQPLLAAILSRAGVQVPYDEMSSSIGVHERVDLGIDWLTLGYDVGVADGTIIDLTLLAATGDMTIVAGRRNFTNEISQFYALDLTWQTSGLDVELAPIKNALGNYVGEYVSAVREEVFYDKATGAVTRIELSLTGQGNDLTFTDIDQSRVTTKFTIPGDQVDQTVLDRAHNLSALIRGVASSERTNVSVGNDPILEEINGLLGSVDVAEYTIITEDGSQLNVVPEIGLTVGLRIHLGSGVTMKHARQLIYQEGIVQSGKLYPTASYRADSYVARTGKDWTALSSNAVGGLWDLVKDAFNWVSQQVTSGVGWTIDLVGRSTSGIVRGTAKLVVPPGIQLQQSTAGGLTTQQTGSITVSGVGWVPTSGTVAGVSTRQMTMQTALGGGFAVGGIYEFQPGDLVLSAPATLTITYTDDAATGIDESRIGLFRWDSTGNNWKAVTAQLDPMNNTATAQVTQLGTYALRYDPTPPQISVVDPTDGATLTTSPPRISAIVSDAGVGIDPTSVQMKVDGQTVTASYNSGTGELTYIPGTPLTAGQHRVTVSATDVVGNTSAATSTFTVQVSGQGGYRVHLPLVSR